MVCLGTLSNGSCRTVPLMAPFRSLSRLLVLAACGLAAGALLRADDAPAAAAGAADNDTMPRRTLAQIIERQQALLDDAAKQGDSLDQDALRSQLQSICHEYDLLLHEAPKMAEAYADYGYLLRQVGMRQESVGLMLKANELDPNIPMVKNEIGNYLAETGKPLEAVGYFMAAIKLAPNEPLYHYQLGKLLYAGRDDFLKSGSYTRDSINRTMVEAFKHAADLAPDNLNYTLAYGEIFYDLPHPDWAAALKFWSEKDAQSTSPLERQTYQLEEAKVLSLQGQTDQARAMLARVTDPNLQDRRQKLVAELDQTAKK
jgi:tetratricopeptide (TPR) repeat protein